MAQNILHHLAIEELKTQAPALYKEYISLFDGLVHFMRQIFKKNQELRKFSNLSQLFDMSRNEAFLEMLIHDGKATYRKHIYFEKKGHFRIGLHGESLEYTNAQDCLEHIGLELRSEQLLDK